MPPAALTSLPHAEARAPLAALFRALTDRPGSLYPLVYIGPVPGGGVVRRELESACRERGLRLGGNDPDVALASPDELEAAPNARQMVVWGTVPFHALPAAAARALAGALRFDPADYADLADTGGSLAPVRARAAFVAAVDELEPEGDRAWPALADLLPGYPPLPPEVEAPAFPLRTFSLRDVLEIADARHESGTLLVYAADRLGWMAVAAGTVVDAARLGDPPGPAPAGLVSARVHEMGTWDDGTVVVVPGETVPGPGVGLSTLAYDLTRLADERAAGRPPSLDPRVGGRAPLAPHRVACALIERGLVRPALVLLRAAEGDPGWGAEDDFLLAMLLATDDPQGASLRLRRAISRVAAAGDLQRDATLAALLLEVRGRKMCPAAAWETVERWLESGGAGWVDSERRAAVVAELALRAGRAEPAAYFLQGVAHFGGSDHPLARTLATHARSAPTSR